MTTANLRRNRPELVSNIRPLRPVPSGPGAFAETAVYWKIRQAWRLAAKTGGIVWLTGPSGIGKTYCLENRLEQDAEAHGIALHRIVLTPATGKNLRAFAALLTGHRAFTGADAAGDIEGRWLNLSHRFGTPPRRAAAIIDEAQLAGLDVMGTLRGIWDSWEPERRAAQREGRASCLPGLVMLGNRVFAQGCGVAKTEEYRRWVDRLLINGTLEGPSVADCAAVAETFPCADAESLALLSEIGAKLASLRAIETAYSLAAALAPAGQLPGAAEIKEAIETHRRMT
jgi:hypothetical protein